MISRRSNVTVGDQLDLRVEFRYDETGTLFDPFLVSKVEILDTNMTTVLETITSITKVSTGIYKAVTSATWNTFARTVYDRWTFDKLSTSQDQYALKNTIIFAAVTPTPPTPPTPTPTPSNCVNGEETRIGLAFNNPDLTSHNGWGNIITPDELRYLYCFGNPLVGGDGNTISDESLQYYIDRAMGSVERDLNIDLIKRRRRYRPWIFGQDRLYDDVSFPDESKANVVGSVNIASGVDLSTYKRIKVSIDKATYVEIDVSNGSTSPVSAADIVTNINTALGKTIASLQSDNNATYLVLRSTTKLQSSYIEFMQPSKEDAIQFLFGLASTTTYHYVYRGWVPDKDFYWDEPYDFNRKAFNEYIYLKLKHRPLVSLYACHFKDIAGGEVADIVKWAKPNYEKGSIEFFPSTGALASLPLYAGASFPLANAYQAITNYPDAFFIDYDSGFANILTLEAKWPEVIQIVGILAAIMCLLDLGEGKMSGIASSSIGLASISESFTTTLSAENTLFGAKIFGWRRELKEFYKNNRNKYSGFLIGSV